MRSRGSVMRCTIARCMPGSTGCGGPARRGRSAGGGWARAGTARARRGHVPGALGRRGCPASITSRSWSPPRSSSPTCACAPSPSGGSTGATSPRAIFSIRSEREAVIRLLPRRGSAGPRPALAASRRPRQGAILPKRATIFRTPRAISPSRGAILPTPRAISPTPRAIFPRRGAIFPTPRAISRCNASWFRGRGGFPDASGDLPEAGNALAEAGNDLSEAGSDLPDASGDLPDASGDLPEAGNDREDGAFRRCEEALLVPRRGTVIPTERLLARGRDDFSPRLGKSRARLG